MVDVNDLLEQVERRLNPPKVGGGSRETDRHFLLSVQEALLLLKEAGISGRPGGPMFGTGGGGSTGSQ